MYGNFLKKLFITACLAIGILFVVSCSDEADEVKTFGTVKVTAAAADNTHIFTNDITAWQENNANVCIKHMVLNSKVSIDILVTRVPSLPTSIDNSSLVITDIITNYTPDSLGAIPLPSRNIIGQMIKIPGTGTFTYNLDIFTLDELDAIYQAGGVMEYEVRFDLHIVELDTNIDKNVPMSLRIRAGDIQTEENDTCTP